MTTLLCSSMQNLTLRQGPSCAPSRRPLSMARCGSKLSSSQSAFAAESRLVAQQPSQALVQQACVVTCKLKTRKAAAKRYKVTGSGKVVIRHPGKQHINEKKSSKRLSQLGKAHCVSDRHLPGIIGNLPYKRIKKSGN